MNRLTMLTVAALVVLMPNTALSHKPDFGEGQYDGPGTAYQIADPALSIVIYREVTCDRQELWMELRVEAGFPLYVQLLTPYIERLANYRPSLAIVGPGLPHHSIGIDIPAGNGAVVFGTRSVEPVLFDERFTGTRDWVLVDRTVTLPRTGTYYVVAWDPAHRTGKLAVTVGTVEKFGLLDLFRFPAWRRATRAFHELDRGEPPTQIVERTCPH